MKTIVTLILSLLLMTACGGNSGPVLTASDVDLRAPIPGRAISPGYLTLHNNDKTPLLIDRIESPQFARIEIHQTTNTDGISRMRVLESVTVPALQSLDLKPGSVHLMLLNPRNTLSDVTLHFYSEDTLLLSVTTGTKQQ